MSSRSRRVGGRESAVRASSSGAGRRPGRVPRAATRGLRPPAWSSEGRSRAPGSSWSPSSSSGWRPSDRWSSPELSASTTPPSSAPHGMPRCKRSEGGRGWRCVQTSRRSAGSGSPPGSVRCGSCPCPRREAERAELGQRGEPEPVAEVVEDLCPARPVGFQFASIGRNPGSRFQRSSTSSAAGG